MKSWTDLWPRFDTVVTGHTRIHCYLPFQEIQREKSEPNTSNNEDVNNILDEIIAKVVETSRVENVNFALPDNISGSNENISDSDGVIPKFANIYQKDAFLIFR